ncbi:MAG: hypothetical protein DWI57_06875 [Chloroflexi bacterium]|nr:MAG: hypothetical protein DWI57_06875 [Chloroflexota bacterium]
MYENAAKNPRKSVFSASSAFYSLVNPLSEILRIEPDATAEAVRRRLARMDDPQVAVVLPNGWSELNSIPRLRLIQRQALARNQQIALVTHDLSTRQAAQQLGIPVYASEQAVGSRTWQMTPVLPVIDPRQPAAGLPNPPAWRTANGEAAGKARSAITSQPSLHRSRQRRIRAAEAWRQPAPLWLQLVGYGLVGAFLLTVLAAFAVYVLPAATVTIIPGQRAVEASVTLTASPDVEVVDVQGRLLPGRLMETYIELTGTIATSGSEQAAQGKAVGQVVFTNQTNREVRIPAGTIVSTSTGSRNDFRTTSETIVPAPQGSQATASIEAVEEGVQGNARANTITTVSGALRTQVGLTNPGATGGGQSALVRVVKQIDKDTLLDQLNAQAQSEAFGRLQPELRANEWLSESSIQTFIVAQFFDHFNDEPADQLGLTLRVLVQGVAVDQETAREIAMAALQEAVPERGKLVADSIQFLADPNATASGRSVTFTIVGRGNYVIPIDNREVRSAVAGLSTEEATALLQKEWLLQRPPEFYVDPDWFGTLPSFGSRIQVRVEFDEAARANE